MKILLALFALAIGLSLSPTPVLAEDVSAPDLKGTWTGPFTAQRWNGRADGVLTLNVLEQEGSSLKAEKFWETPGKPGNVGGKDTEDATEPMVGVIDFDGRSVFFAEQDDNGLYRGTLTAPDTLELVYLEAGSANVYRVRLTRKK
jgi:hypothetical protein